MNERKLSVSWLHLRAACIFAKSYRPPFAQGYVSEVIIDTDGRVYGISEGFLYQSPEYTATLFSLDQPGSMALDAPVVLEIPQLLPNDVAAVLISVPDDLDKYSTVIMNGHNLEGNPISMFGPPCWAGVGIRYARDKKPFEAELSRLASAKQLLAERLGADAQVSGALPIPADVLNRVIEARDVEKALLPGTYPQMTFQFVGSAQPMLISLGCIEGTVLAMPGSGDQVVNEFSELGEGGAA